MANCPETHYIIKKDGHYCLSIWATRVEQEPNGGTVRFFNGKTYIAALEPLMGMSYEEWNSKKTEVNR